jgi:hypothetical protein
MQVLEITRDNAQTPQWARKPADSTWQQQLTADTVQAVAVPSNARLALFSFDNDCFFAISTFTLPTGSGSSVSNGIELNPASWDVTALQGQNIYARSRYETDVTISFYR